MYRDIAMDAPMFDTTKFSKPLESRFLVINKNLFWVFFTNFFYIISNKQKIPRGNVYTSENCGLDASDNFTICPNLKVNSWMSGSSLSRF